MDNETAELEHITRGEDEILHTSTQIRKPDLPPHREPFQLWGYPSGATQRVTLVRKGTQNTADFRRREP